MNPLLSQVATSQWPQFFAVLAGGVGAVGIGSAVMAYASTSRDRALIESAKSILTSSESWHGAHANTDHDLSEWMRKRGLATESGVADIIRACWSAWLGSRAATLTELHVLVARRERSKTPARLSAGIAALLLVIGIVGTLFSVKPILKQFQFKISAPIGEISQNDADSTDLVNDADNTDLINSLMRNLGDAFLPSLFALGFTILVVVSRGVYSLGLNRYTLELDRFAMGTVMPNYRPRSITDEYEEVRITFRSLAESIGEREKRFEKIVNQLAKFVENVETSLHGLSDGVVKMSSAADVLASRSSSIGTTLTRTLGKKSPLYAAVNGFESVFERTNEKIQEISVHIDRITADHEKVRGQMIETLEEISGAIEKVEGDHKADREAVDKMIDDLKTLISVLPKQTIAVAQETFDSGIKEMQIALAASLSEQKIEAASTHQGIRDETGSTLDLIKKTLSEASEQITKSGKAIPATLRSIDTTLFDASQKLSEATSAIPAAIERIDSTLSEARERLSETEAAIPRTLESLDKALMHKSETEQAAVNGIRSVAKEAISQIKKSRPDVAKSQSLADLTLFKKTSPTSLEPQISSDGDVIPESQSTPSVGVRQDRKPADESQPNESSASLTDTESVEADAPITKDPLPQQAVTPDTIPIEEARKTGFFNRMFHKL